MSEEKYEVRIRPEKEAIVAEMKEKLASQGVVLVSFNKLDVKNATLLRRKFLAHGVEYKVIKNTLTRIAADELGLEVLTICSLARMVLQPAKTIRSHRQQL